MSLLPREQWARIEGALAAIEADSVLKEAVLREVGAFYDARPHLERTRFGEAFVASLVVEKLSQAADSQSGAGTKPKTEKVA